MYEEQFLAEKLQQFSLLDIALVKIVYFLVGLLVATNYIVLTSVSWIFYLLMFLIAVFPIVIHLFSFEGSYIQKARKYLKTNKPSYQVLLFFSMFFFACTLAVLIPALSLVPWYVYMILIIIFAIKPMRSNMFW
ncbi:hypothetical protein IBE20_03295 [Francisella tularensis subsp. novicida]|uniref:Uncharacterized protein n=2 Tax=Francisella tularensis TaxID=263 RepID=A0A6I4RRA9_FRATU|nr:hypothetical protein [Francisella tularensis]ABK90318.1 hypothetical membrane protein [Francisella tularensis subsp. novicida U112]AJI61968.1 putative membrane protein [Francisella tularensis subsp. novicida U112]AVC43777.1 hypothetical protein B4919_02775 [Francisella tularensis subsp. novicida]EDX20091.1 hypothetical protein FTE_0837 [Francisella tularensis subsp. novicida FTE]MBK2035916.1 hypothetical protein [Francisella tularensis subsp. novicida]